MRITEISPQKKNPKRYNVYLDGVFFCGMDIMTIASNRLKVGTEIEAEELGLLQKQAECSTAGEKALNYCTVGNVKSEKEVRDYLKKKGYADDTVDEVIEKLKGYGYISDEEYAKAYVENYKSVKGKRLISYELKRKGISDKDIEKGVSEIDDEFESAYQVACKYVRNKEKTRETFLKCYKYLISKGFNYDDAKSASEKATEISVDEY